MNDVRVGNSLGSWREMMFQTAEIYTDRKYVERVTNHQPRARAAASAREVVDFNSMTL